MINKLLDTFVNSYNIFKNSIDNGRDAAYELLACSIAFNRSPYFSKDNCWNAIRIDGYYKTNGADGKIDGYDVIGNDHEIVIKLMQSKNSTQISTPNIRDFFNAVKNYVVNTQTSLTPEFSSLSVLRDKISAVKQKHNQAIMKYEVYLVCNDVSSAINTSLNTEFSSIFSNTQRISLHFIKNSQIQIEITRIKKEISKGTFNDASYTLKLSQETNPTLIGSDSVYVSTIDANEVINLIDNEFRTNVDLTRLFQGNVRGFLGDTLVNEDIKRTINSSAKRFLPLNNGAVIVCDSIVQREGNEYVIKNPVIVNGQQTFASIYKYAKNNFQKENIKVSVKLISVSSNKDYEMEEIAKASNQANNVDELDLLSNKVLIKKLKDHFSQQGYYLKIKSGEILNDVFFGNDEFVDFSDLLKMWVSYELEYPSDGKTTKKNIKMIVDAYNPDYTGNKKRLIRDSNFDILSSSMFKIVRILELQPLIKQHFVNETYYDHAQYFTCYLFKKMFGEITEEIIDSNIDGIKSTIEHLISLEKERKNNNNQEYTHNNYFKSTRPVQDYLQNQNLQTLDEKLSVLLPNL